MLKYISGSLFFGGLGRSSFVKGFGVQNMPYILNPRALNALCLTHLKLNTLKTLNGKP